MWIAGLLVALALIAVDAVPRLRKIESLQGAFGGPPAVDASSPTGYALGQRGLIIPAVGFDGLHWIMQTQMMLAGGGLRIRSVGYDNAPAGREVHWSSSLRWWLASVAWVHHAVTGTPVAMSVERVAPWGNTVVLVLVLVLGVPIIARRFGAVAAATMAVAMVAVKTYVSTFAVGNLDHHGFAATAGLLSVLCLLAGGAGWVRVSMEEDAIAGADARLGAWLPDFAAARRWFVAAGIMGGAGLWISAASQTPVLIGIAVGALWSAWLGRRSAANAAWRVEPALWRTWGIAGALSSLCFYLVEYFPSHVGWRLEVNHPLFAIGWAGGGYLIFRCCAAIVGGGFANSRREWMAIVVSIAAAAALPCTIALAPARTFWVADSFLWALHLDYIGEFDNFFKFWNSVSWVERLSNVSLLPVLCVVLPMLLWRRLSAPARALIVLGWPAGIFGLVLAFRQTRWWGLADAIWLGLLPATVFIVMTYAPRRRLSAVIGGASLALLLLPYPVISTRDWAEQGWQDRIEWDEVLSLIARDVSQTLRARTGATVPVVLSGPSVTTLLAYYGGARGLGTFYWENLPGLRGAAEIYAARTADEAHALIRARGVTHIVLFSWDLFADQYTRLAHGVRDGTVVPRPAFVLDMLTSGKVPAWLVMSRYALPEDERVRNEWVLVFEVVAEGR